MKRRRLNIARLLWLMPAVLWLAVLFYFSGQSGVESGELSTGLAQRLLDRMPNLNISLETMDHILRKTAHFGIFAVEGFLLRIGLGIIRPRRWDNVLIATVVSGGVAVLNELHQLTAEGRSCMPKDMLLDACGAFAGAIFAVMVDCTIRELKRRRLDRRAQL